MKKRYQKKILFFVFGIFIVISGYMFFTKENFSSLKSIQANAWEERITEPVAIGTEENEIQKLKEEYQNEEVKAILSIENSDFSYPVVQTTNNDYYLTHNIRLEKDAYGAIYADYRIDLNTSQKKLIFGHSSSKIETPFNTLEEYYNKEYYDNHKYIILQTEQETYRYEIFSVYVETSDFTYMNLSFDSKLSWYQHLLILKSKSLYSTDIEISEDDDILIMQTCSKHPDYKKNSKKYLLIVSRRV